MEPMTLITAALSMLAPYLVKSGEKIAEEMGCSLWKWLKSKFDGKANLPENPTEEDKTEIQKHLMAAVVTDAIFVKELEEKINEIIKSKPVDGGQMNVVNNGTVEKQINITTNSGPITL